MDNDEVGNSPAQPVGSSWKKSVMTNYLYVFMNNVLTKDGWRDDHKGQF